jgi:hypothetical protein
MSVYNLSSDINSNMSKYEIAQKMAGYMQQNKTIHYEFKIYGEGHATGITRIRIYDNGLIKINLMNPAHGSNGFIIIRNFKGLYNVFVISPR